MKRKRNLFIITIVLSMCAIFVACGAKTEEREGKKPQVEEMDLNGTNHIFLDGEWVDEKYGVFVVNHQIDKDKIIYYWKYEAPSDDLDNLNYVYTAMNCFVGWTNDDESEYRCVSALPGEDAALLTYTCSDGVGFSIGSEIDGTSVSGDPSWVQEYNEIDQDLIVWLLECNAEAQDCLYEYITSQK